MKGASEVIVVGAGIIGCATAYELASRGANVRVVDARAPGMGATQASAGMLAPSIEGRPADSLRALGRRSLALYESFVGGVTAASGTAIEFNRCGTLEVATTRDRLGHLEQSWSGAGLRAGGTAQVLDRDATRQRVPALTDDVLGGVFIGEHAYVAAETLTGALVHAAEAMGVSFHASCEVKGVHLDTPSVRVETSGGSFSAGVLIVAAGSWSGLVGLPQAAAPPVRPVRGQLLRLHWPETPLPHILWGERCYLVPWRDGTLLLGATSEDVGFDEHSTVAGVRDLLEAACDLVPHIWQSHFAEVRVGLRPGSPDDLPIVGRSSRHPGLVYATGHYRNGILLAPLTASLVADLIVADRHDDALEVMSPARLGL